jgi:hypothetical protein
MKILRILGIFLSFTILYIPIGLFFGSLIQRESRLNGRDDKLGFWLGYSLNLIGVLIFYSPSIKNLLLSIRTYYTIITFIVLYFVLFFVLFFILSSIITEIQFLYSIVAPICILISMSLSPTIVNYFYKK